VARLRVVVFCGVVGGGGGGGGGGVGGQPNVGYQERILWILFKEIMLYFGQPVNLTLRMLVNIHSQK